MLESVRRRLCGLERSIQLPVTAQLFWTRVHEHSRITGASFDDAFRAEMVKLSAQELDDVQRGMEEIAFGGDTAALEAYYSGLDQSSRD